MAENTIETLMFMLPLRKFRPRDEREWFNKSTNVPIVSESQDDLDVHDDMAVPTVDEKHQFFQINGFSVRFRVAGNVENYMREQRDGRTVSRRGARPNTTENALQTRMDMISVERHADLSSIQIFDVAAHPVELERAHIVKRKVTGTGRLRAFFVLDIFEGLITSVQWSSDEMVKETIEIVARRVRVNYLPQTFSGEVDDDRWVQQEWTYQQALGRGEQQA